jgi:hypothetical protein
MSRFIDLVGNQYGRWNVVSRAENQKKHAQFNCVCKCGTEKVVLGINLRHGRTLSCGCLLLETVTKHGHTTSGGRFSSTYGAWVNMKTRCYSKAFKQYKDYGGRGITVCSRWLNSFECFLEDMGERPFKLQIDRINNNGNYEPNNCKWSSPKENMANRRCSKLSIN